MGRTRYGETNNEQETSIDDSSQSVADSTEQIITNNDQIEQIERPSPTPQNISDVIIENANPKQGFLTSSGTYVNIYKNAGDTERTYTTDKTVNPAGQRIDPSSAEGQIIQNQYAEQADRRVDNLAQSERFWAIREGQGSVKDLLYDSQTPEQRRLTGMFFDERNLDINTPLNQLSLSPKRYQDARDQLSSGEGIPKDGVKVPDSIWLKTDSPTNSTLKTFDQYKSNIITKATTPVPVADKITGFSENASFSDASYNTYDFNTQAWNPTPIDDGQKQSAKDLVDDARSQGFNFITIKRERDGVPDSTITIPITGTQAYSKIENEFRKSNVYGQQSDTISIQGHVDKQIYDLPEGSISPKIPINMPSPVASFLGGGLTWFNYLESKKSETKKPEISYNEYLTGVPDSSFNDMNNGMDYREKGGLGVYGVFQNYGAMIGAVTKGGDVGKNLQESEFMDTGLDSFIRIAQAGLAPNSMGYDEGKVPQLSTGRQRIGEGTNSSSIGAMSKQIAIEGSLWQKYPTYYASSLLTDVGMAIATLPVGGFVAMSAGKVAVASVKTAVKLMPALTTTNQLRVAVIARTLTSGTLKALPTVLLGGVGKGGSTITLSTLKNMSELELKAYNFVDLRQSIDEAPVLSGFDGVRETEMLDLYKTSSDLTQREIDQIDPTSFKSLQQTLDSALVDGQLSRETINRELNLAKNPVIDQGSYRDPMMSLETRGKATVPSDNDYLDPIDLSKMSRTPMVNESFSSSALPKDTVVGFREDIPRGVFEWADTKLDITKNSKDQINYTISRGFDEANMESYSIQTNIKKLPKKEKTFSTILYGSVGSEKQSFNNFFLDPSDSTKSSFNLIPVNDKRFPDAWKVAKSDDDVYESWFIKYSTDDFQKSTPSYVKEEGDWFGAGLGTSVSQRNPLETAIKDYQMAKGRLADLEKLDLQTKYEKIKSVKTKFTSSGYTIFRRTSQSYKNAEKKKSKADLKLEIKELKASIQNEYLPKAKESALRIFDSELNTKYIDSAIAKIPEDKRNQLRNDPLFAYNVNLNKLSSDDRYAMAQKLADAKDQPVSIDDYYNLERVSGADDVLSLEGRKNFISTENAFISADITGRSKNRELADSIIEYRTLKAIQGELQIPSEKLKLETSLNKSLMTVQKNIISTNAGMAGMDMPLKANTKTTKFGWTGSRSRITSDIDELNFGILEKQDQINVYNVQLDTLQKKIKMEKDGQSNYIELGKDSGVGFVPTNQGLYTPAQVNYVLEGYMQSTAVVDGVYAGVRPVVRESKPFTASTQNPSNYNIEKIPVSSEQLGRPSNYDITVDNISIEDLMRDDITSVSMDPSETSYNQLKRVLNKDESIQRIDYSLGSADADVNIARTASDTVEQVKEQRRFDKALSVQKSSKDWLSSNLEGFSGKPDTMDEVLKLKKRYGTEYNDSAGFFAKSTIREPINPQSTRYNAGSPEQTYLNLLRKESVQETDSNILSMQIADLKKEVRMFDSKSDRLAKDALRKDVSYGTAGRYRQAIESVQDKPYISDAVKKSLRDFLTLSDSENKFISEMQMSQATNKPKYEAMQIVQKEYTKLKDAEILKIKDPYEMKNGKRVKKEYSPTDARREIFAETKTVWTKRITQLESDRVKISNSLTGVRQSIDNFDPNIKKIVTLEEKNPFKVKLQSSNKRVRALESEQDMTISNISKLVYKIDRSRGDISLLKGRYDVMAPQPETTTVGAGFQIRLSGETGSKFDAKRVREIKEMLPNVGLDIPKSTSRGFYIERILGDKNYADMQTKNKDSLVFETEQQKDPLREIALTNVNIKVTNANKQLVGLKDDIVSGDYDLKNLDAVIDNFDDTIKVKQKSGDKLEVEYLKIAKKEYEDMRGLFGKASDLHSIKEKKAKVLELKLVDINAKVDAEPKLDWSNMPANSKMSKKHNSLLDKQRDVEMELEFSDINAKLTDLQDKIPDLRMSVKAGESGFNKETIGKKSNFFAFGGSRRFDFIEEKGITKDQLLMEAKSLVKESSKTKRTKEQKTVYDAMVRAQSRNAVQPQGSPFLPLPIFRYPQNTPQDIQDNQVELTSLPSDITPSSPQGFALDVPMPQSMSIVTPNTGARFNFEISSRLSTDVIPKLDTASMFRIIQPLKQKINTPVIQGQFPIQDQFRIQAIRSPIVTSTQLKPILQPPVQTAQNIPSLPIPPWLPPLPYTKNPRRKKTRPKKMNKKKVYWDVPSTPFEPFNPKEYYTFKNEPRSIKFKEKRRNFDGTLPK
jgi:hypothetical protein